MESELLFMARQKPRSSLFEVEQVPDNFWVVRFDGSEGLSSLFEFEVEVIARHIDVGALVGRYASLKIAQLSEPRIVHGLILRAEYAGEVYPRAIYRLTLVPWIHRLLMRTDCRIFSDLTVPQIVTRVLREAGLPKSWLRLELGQHRYREREYCVQYRESDLNFIHRLLEDEGIFYYFEHEERRHVLVLTDRAGGGPSVAGEPRLPYRETGGKVSDREHVSRFRVIEELRPGHVTTRGFDFATPDSPVEVSRTARQAQQAGLDLYDYVGGLQKLGPTDPSPTDRDLEAAQATRRHGLGESDCPRLAPGFVFALANHPLQELDGEHCVVRVHHSGEQSGTIEPGASQDLVYRNEFMCIEREQTYRAPRITPRPTVRGVQTATVVGASSEEVDVDERARVKIQFHWDRRDRYDEFSSCWAPVSQLWAGAGYGAMFIPRARHEVIVEFIEGDPDRPVITGRLYHDVNQPPLLLPDHKSRSTIKSESIEGGGSNELRFEDRRGGEQLFLHAQRDMDLCVRNDRRTSVLHDEHRLVHHNRVEKVVGDSHETVEGDATAAVKGALLQHLGGSQLKVDQSVRLGVGADVHITIGGSEYVDIAGSRHSNTGGKSVHAIAGDAVVDAGGVVHIKATTIVIEATAGITLKGPGGFVTVDAAGVSIQGTAILLNSGGAALTGPGGAPTAPQQAEVPAPTPPRPAEGDP